MPQCGLSGCALNSQAVDIKEQKLSGCPLAASGKSLRDKLSGDMLSGRISSIPWNCQA